MRRIVFLFFWMSFFFVPQAKAELIGRVLSPSGHVVMNLPAGAPAMTSLGFTNHGSAAVSLSNVKVLSGSTVVSDSQIGLGLSAGGGITWVFKSCDPQELTTIEFDVSGQTSEIEVNGWAECGPVPGGFSAGN